jgi:MoxR-like ATPase
MTIVEEVQEKIDRVMAEMRKAIVGQDEILEFLFVALLCEGHVLIEGVPGTAKTLMVRTLSHALGLDFNRIQFTPDLMPSDIVGTNIFEMNKGEFRLVKGPVFSELLLADEINRAPAKTQSALLEVMEERQVTIDGHSHKIGEFFTVFATQNPVEYEGTYPLPEAVLDRFLIKINVDYPSPEEEDQILKNFNQGFDARHLDKTGISAVLTRADLIGLKQRVRGLEVKDSLIVYIRQLIHQTRNSPHILVGGSPRASITLLIASKALATLAGRDFVTPDDIKRMILPVLRHRLVLQPDAELEGLDADIIIRRILDQVKVPR